MNPPVMESIEYIITPKEAQNYAHATEGERYNPLHASRIDGKANLDQVVAGMQLVRDALLFHTRNRQLHLPTSISARYYAPTRPGPITLVEDDNTVSVYQQDERRLSCTIGKFNGVGTITSVESAPCELDQPLLRRNEYLATVPNELRRSGDVELAARAFFYAAIGSQALLDIYQHSTALAELRRCEHQLLYREQHIGLLPACRSEQINAKRIEGYLGKPKIHVRGGALRMGSVMAASETSDETIAPYARVRSQLVFIPVHRP